MKRRNSTTKNTWHWALGLLVALGASLLLATTVWALGVPSSGQRDGQSGAAKLARLHEVDAEATAAAKSWHAPKLKRAAPATASRPASCPRSSLPTGIYYGDTGGFHEQITNSAIISPSANRPFEYIVFAGAYAAKPQQGLLIVVQLVADPCASASPIGTTQITYHPTPAQQGAVTLTQIVGAELTYTSAGGGTGQFNFISGQFG